MFKVANRIKESSLTTGTGSVVLNGAINGFQTFLNGIGDGNSTFYAIENESQWEVGVGTYTQSTNSLSRDVIYESSNSGNKISLTRLSTVFCTYPADRAIYQNDQGKVSIGRDVPSYQLDVLGSGRFDTIVFGDGTTQSSSPDSYLTALVASGVAISGWTKYYVDSQDHSASAVSGLISSSYLPYSGAIKNTDMGTFSLNASGIAAKSLNVSEKFVIGSGNPPIISGGSTSGIISIFGDASDITGSGALLSLNAANTSNATWKFRIASDVGSPYPYGALCIDSRGGSIDTNRLTINRQNGNVGIGGVTNPLAGVHVIGFTPALWIANQSGVNLFKRFQVVCNSYDESKPVTIIAGQNDQNNNDLWIGGNRSDQYASTVIRFFTASGLNVSTGSERARIDSSGNLGVGTINPTTKLDVAGTIEVKNSTNSQSLRVYNTYANAGVDYERGVIDWITTSNVLRIGTEAAGTGTVRNISLIGGNVGIGTTSPNEKVTVDNGANFGTIMQLTTSNGNGGYLRLTAGTRTVRFGADSSIGPHFGSTQFGGVAFLDVGQMIPIFGLTGSNGVCDIGRTDLRWRTLFSNNIDLSGQSVSGSSATSLLELAATWNTTGAPTAIKLNVTDTASSASSLLLDLQVGGSSRFKVDKNGSLTISGPRESGNLISVNTTGYGAFSVNYQSNVSCGTVSCLNITWKGSNGADDLYVYTPTLALRGTGSAYITDTLLTRDAAGTLAQRNSTNAQTFRIYNTYTDASNYERLAIQWSNNILSLANEKAGSGSFRMMTLGANYADASNYGYITITPGSYGVNLGCGFNTSTSSGSIFFTDGVAFTKSSASAGDTNNGTTIYKTGISFATRSGNILIQQGQKAGYDDPTSSLTISAQPAATSSVTNITGGPLYLVGGAGNSTSSGAANGGHIYLDGGQGYGTGVNGDVIVGNSRGNLVVKNGQLSFSGQSLTGSSATSLIDASTTWNTSGTPTAIKLNVTDTASNASSLLMDLQVGGASKFKVDKSGIGTFSSSIRQYDQYGVMHELRTTLRSTMLSIANVDILGVIGSGSGMVAVGVVPIVKMGTSNSSLDGEINAMDSGGSWTFTTNYPSNTIAGTNRRRINSASQTTTDHFALSAASGYAVNNESMAGTHLLLRAGRATIAGTATAANGGDVIIESGSSAGNGSHGMIRFRRESGNDFLTFGVSGTSLLYNTNDATTSNYERAKIAWESNVLKIGTEKAGTGSARALELQTDGTTRLTIGAANGNVSVNLAANETWLSLQYAATEYIKLGLVNSGYGIGGGSVYTSPGSITFGSNAASIRANSNVDIGTASASFTIFNQQNNTTPHLTIKTVGYTTKPSVRIESTAAQTADSIQVFSDAGTTKTFSVLPNGDITAANATFSGALTAISKSFLIDHPSKPGMKLQYGSLESPYHGVRITGEGVAISGYTKIDLPDYMFNLIKTDGINIQLTAIGHYNNICVGEVNSQYFTVLCNSNEASKFYWTFTAIRKDVEDLIIEI